MMRRRATDKVKKKNIQYHRLSKLITWLIDHGITDDQKWILEDFDSYIVHNATQVKRTKARRALSIVRRYMCVRETSLRYILHDDNCVARDISENTIYKILEYQNLNPNIVATILWMFLSAKRGKKNCLWLSGKADSGIIEFANSLVSCVPLYGILMGHFTMDDLSECIDKMLILWRDFPTIALRSLIVRSILTGTIVKLKIKNVSRVINKTPVIICSDKQLIPNFDHDPEMEHIRSKMWKIHFPKTIPRYLNSVCTLDVKEYVQWIFTIGVNDNTVNQLNDVFEILPDINI